MEDRNQSIKRERWRIVPAAAPAVKRNCSKCKEKREFINSMKFRVNANGKNVDVWLIYRCKTCSTTWNMTLYERCAVNEIPRKEYEGFLRNDRHMAERFGSRWDLLAKNKAEAVMGTTEYTVETEAVDKAMADRDCRLIEFELPFPMTLRLDSLLAEQLGVSRSRVKRWCSEGIIYAVSRGPAVTSREDRLYREKIKAGMVIGIRGS